MASDIGPVNIAALIPLHEVNEVPYGQRLDAADARQAYMVSDSVMATVSPVNGHSPTGQQSRKRTHSQMQNELDVSHARDSIGPREGSSAAEDEQSPTRGSRVHKRGEPPVNNEGKFYCAFAPECAGQVFDRKCEWSKHMDRHDRPYRCSNPACSKLQGFTYSGGLLRHEREVHGKHGGPKAHLQCPFADCARHRGKGFTRKENLSEHLRRVHKESGTLMPVPTAEMYATTGAEPLPDLLEQAAQGARQYHNDLSHLDPPKSPKYNKTGHAEPRNTTPVDEQGLREEVRRLRAELAEKDVRLRELEAALHHLSSYQQQLQR
ncbi:hypothetical protein K470DRAFT_259812 [Piedraia hortae CBS 480.64]|uniref:C2H2-type domain-containing protein n=1 Tax=Piedraia hortae CBS 480.64 TaxID=1314780 RepID=A0A6A7BTW0_9PEZI|nr:hypothetical protein K470DRAFT_259812 [Piedraia hortae CBS 480.64]